MSGYPPLSRDLRSQLELITPSCDRDLRYYPCAVTLDDGYEIDRVYVVEEGPYLRHWGIRPERDSAKTSVPIERVVSIRESPFRLPPRLATELYDAGESGMGYCVFVVEFSDGTRQSYVTGNAVDFITAPLGKIPSDACRVFPHEGRERHAQRGPHYAWCLYGGESGFVSTPGEHD